MVDVAKRDGVITSLLAEWKATIQELQIAESGKGLLKEARIKVLAFSKSPFLFI